MGGGPGRGNKVDSTAARPPPGVHVCAYVGMHALAASLQLACMYARTMDAAAALLPDACTQVWIAAAGARGRRDDWDGRWLARALTFLGLLHTSCHLLEELRMYAQHTLLWPVGICAAAGWTATQASAIASRSAEEAMRRAGMMNAAVLLVDIGAGGAPVSVTDFCCRCRRELGVAARCPERAFVAFTACLRMSPMPRGAPARQRHVRPALVVGASRLLRGSDT